MTRLNLIIKELVIARSITAGATSARGCTRAFAVAPTRPLQKLFKGDSSSSSKKEKEQEEACAKALEAAESLKDGAKQVKETCEFVRETAETTSNTVTRATKEVTDRVTQATDLVKEKMKEPMDGMLSDAWGKATKRIEDKMVDKIKDRVLGEEAQNEVKQMVEKAKKESRD